MGRTKVAVLVGPTAVGKTAVAIDLALGLGGEIVNADSLQIYRELDIGTAKPTPAERALVPHHLVDIASPDEAYDAARYMREARQVIRELKARGVLPLVVGGTGLYIKALLHGLFADGGSSPAIRERLQEEVRTQSLAALHERLSRVDPETAARLPPGDTYRIVRALEVVEATGRPLSAHLAEHLFRDSPYATVKLGLIRPREELNARIDHRVDLMLAAGWLEEVERLLNRYEASIKPLQSLGYRHLVAYLQGQVGWEEAVAQIKRDTRRYAKRQLTWFRADPEVRWFHPGQQEEMLALLDSFCENRLVMPWCRWENADN